MPLTLVSACPLKSSLESSCLNHDFVALKTQNNQMSLDASPGKMEFKLSLDARVQLFDQEVEVGATLVLRIPFIA